MKNLKCGLCDKSFNKPRALRGHIASAHGRAKRAYHRKAAMAHQAASDRTLALAYCPCCGTNLRTVAMALRAAEGLK